MKTVLTVATALTMLFGAILFLRFIVRFIWAMWLNQEARSRRKLRGVATPIAQVEEGQLVKLTGKLRHPRGQPPLEAPISTKACAYFRVVICEGDGPESKDVLDNEQGQDFILDDDTGRALVRAEGASVVVGYHAATTHSTNNDNVARYTADNAHRARGTWDGKQERSAVEFLLCEGDRVSVLGRAIWEPDPEPGGESQGYRGQARRVVILAPDGGKVHVSNL